MQLAGAWKGAKELGYLESLQNISVNVCVYLDYISVFHPGTRSGSSLYKGETLESAKKRHHPCFCLNVRGHSSFNR